jgi:NAD/NADP transhydrogenase beta subunit
MNPTNSQRRESKMKTIACLVVAALAIGLLSGFCVGPALTAAGVSMLVPYTGLLAGLYGCYFVQTCVQ